MRKFRGLANQEDLQTNSSCKARDDLGTSQAPQHQRPGQPHLIQLTMSGVLEPERWIEAKTVLSRVNRRFGPLRMLIVLGSPPIPRYWGANIRNIAPTSCRDGSSARCHRASASSVTMAAGNARFTSS